MRQKEWWDLWQFRDLKVWHLHTGKLGPAWVSIFFLIPDGSNVIYGVGSREEDSAEIQRRLKIVREGTASGRPAAEVFADIRAKYL